MLCTDADTVAAEPLAVDILGGGLDDPSHPASSVGTIEMPLCRSVRNALHAVRRFSSSPQHDVSQLEWQSVGRGR